MSDSRIKLAYENLHQLFPEFTPTILNATNDEEYQLNLMELNNYAYHEIRKQNRGYPSGYWYMATLTSKPEDSKEDILANHKKVMDRLGDQVIHASLEKSNIWHVHYLLRLKNIKRNIDRDVTGMCKRFFKTEHCITSKKKWNGACKYILKRDYCDEKADTKCETLKEGIFFKEGSGYTIA